MRTWNAADWVWFSIIMGISAFFVLILSSALVQDIRYDRVPPETLIKIQELKLECLKSGGEPTENTGFFLWEQTVQGVSCENRTQLNP